MSFPRTPIGVATTAADALVGAAVAAVGTVGVVFALAVIAGFVLLARRSRSGPPPRVTGPRMTGAGVTRGAADDLPHRADIALVRLDDEVAEMTDELGYAVAQFGEQTAARLAAALDRARHSLTESFTLKQQLDDEVVDSAAQVREWNGRIVRLCEAARTSLALERRTFDELRGRERGAAADLDAVRRELSAARARLPATAERVERMTSRFSAVALAAIVDNPAEASAALDAAEGAAGRAGQALGQAESGPSQSGPSSAGPLPVGARPAAALVREAEVAVHRARALIDSVDAREDAFEASASRLAALVVHAREQLDSARKVRDAPPDATTGDAVIATMAALERALIDPAHADPAHADPVHIHSTSAHAEFTDQARAARRQADDPDARISAIDAALDALDTALAGARNQAQRLEHARVALIGALLTARSQIDTTTAYLASRRGRTGAQARTRLAEATRLLLLAEAEADPVVALDTARSSATYSRDADALARHDLMQ